MKKSKRMPNERPVIEDLGPPPPAPPNPARGFKGRGPDELASLLRAFRLLLAVQDFHEAANGSDDVDIAELLKAHADLAELPLEAFARVVGVEVRVRPVARAATLTRDRSPWAMD